MSAETNRLLDSSCHGGRDGTLVEATDAQYASCGLSFIAVSARSAKLRLNHAGTAAKRVLNGAV